MSVILEFPAGFLWGTSLAAYQAEGGIENNWTDFAKKTGQKKFDAGRACDHYSRFKEDFDLAKYLHTNAHRFSIEWARIEPKEGQFDEDAIQHYLQVLGALKQRDIKPFVSLWHITLPAWFDQKGGWLNKQAPEIFQRFVKKIVQALGTHINFWIILNEPMVYVSSSYCKGAWPPGCRNFFKVIKVILNLIRAQRLAYQTIHQHIAHAQVGTALNAVYFDFPLACVADYFWNKFFLNQIKNYQDFIGVNYYSRISLSLKEGKKKRSDLGWEIFPEGIYHLLKEFQRYQKPIYVTENGLADAQDKNREEFIREHLLWIHKAIEDGVDVRGYFIWSLMDNFEWDKGYWPRFGLYEVDYKTMERIIRPSAEFFKEICRTSTLIIK